MKTRPVTADDVATLAIFRVSLLEETGGTLDPDVRESLLSANDAFFRNNLDSHSWKSWCVEVDGGIVAIGTLAFFDRPPYPGNIEGRDAYLLNMFTLPSHRGRGVATAIVKAMLQYAQLQGVRKIVLHATEEGRRIYTTFGFVASAAYMELVVEPHTNTN
jgi:GNAT superfamily N-acetyltransferase